MAFVTFSVSWELFNVVLLVVKALSSRGQEIKASAHQFHYVAATGGSHCCLTVEHFTHAQTVSLKIDVMQWFHFF